MTKRMKLNVKDLAPNPYRDISNYPIDRAKVEALKASINETGFWDNVIARKPSYANYHEIAYGHHRLQALREIIEESGESITIEVPVKDLSDTLMLKIMANENMEAWSLGVLVIDETVKVTKKFLDDHPEEILTKDEMLTSSRQRAQTDGLTLYQHTREAFQIAEFLGKAWSEERVYNALTRLQATGQIPDERKPKKVKDPITGERVEKKRTKVDQKAVQSLSSDTTATAFVKAVDDADLTPAQQRKAAKEIIKSGNVGKAGVEAAVNIVKNPPSSTPKKIKKQLPTDFDQSMADLAGDIRKVNKGLDDLSKILTKHGDIVVDKLTAIQLTTSMKSMYLKAEKILKKANIIN